MKKTKCILNSFDFVAAIDIIEGTLKLCSLFRFNLTIL